MTRDHGRPRAADALNASTKAPKRGLQSFLGVSTILALVLAAGAAPAGAADYFFRSKAAPIVAAAAPPATPAPAVPEWTAEGMLALKAGSVYVTGPTYAELMAAGLPALVGNRIASMHNVPRASGVYLQTYNWTLGYSYMVRSMDEALAPFGVRASARGDRIALKVSAPGVWLTPASQAGEGLLRRLDLREVTQ